MNNIKRLRKYLKLTQTEFAEKLGVTLRAVQYWESENVKINESSLKIIELVFNVNSVWLRSGDGDMFNTAINNQLPPTFVNEKVKELRIALGLTQEAFARKLSKAVKTIQRYETDYDLDDATIIMLCGMFNVNSDWLLKGVGDIFNDTDKNYFNYHHLGVDLREKVKSFLNLPPEKQEQVFKYIQNLQQIEEADKYVKNKLKSLPDKNVG